MELQQKTTPPVAAFKQHLDTALTPAYRILMICGFGEPPAKFSNICFKAIYAIHSAKSVALIAFLLIRLFFLLDYSRKFDFAAAETVLAVIYELQAFLSAIFLIYKTRTGQFRLLKTRWQEYGADPLVAHTDFDRRKWMWLVPLFVLYLGIIAMATTDVVLNFIGSSISASEARQNIPMWQCVLMIPAKILDVVAWLGAYYIFYVVTLALTYAWRGFIVKLKKYESSSKESTFDEDRLRFVTETHKQLSLLTNTVGEVFGSYAAFMIILSIPDLFLHLYFASHMPPEGTLRSISVFSMLISFTSMYLLFTGSMVHTVTSEIPDVFYDHYYAEMKKDGARSAVSEKSLLEASILLTKLYNTRIYVSAGNLFVISKETLGAIFSVLGTAYFIFLMDPGGPPPGTPGVHNLTVINA